MLLPGDGQGIAYINKKTTMPSLREALAQIVRWLLSTVNQQRLQHETPTLIVKELTLITNQLPYSLHEAFTLAVGRPLPSVALPCPSHEALPLEIKELTLRVLTDRCTSCTSPLPWHGSYNKATRGYQSLSTHHAPCLRPALQ